MRSNELELARSVLPSDLDLVPISALLALLLVAVVAIVVIPMVRHRRHTPAKPDADDTGLGSAEHHHSGIVLKKLPNLADDELDELDANATQLGAQIISAPTALPIVYDQDADADEPTGQETLFVTVGHGQSDRGLRRSANEDSLLVSEANSLYVVADGMGGHRGGAVASKLAVDTIAAAFEGKFPENVHGALPRRASELITAIQKANVSVLTKASQERTLAGMGTTLSAALFSPKKQRLYVGHVGDSRVYRFRANKLEQMTSDHTMRSLGVEGEGAGMLSRALGVSVTLPIDIVIATPLAGDYYLLCSDGLSRMVGADEIAKILGETNDPHEAAKRLIESANASGGEDNVTVVVVKVAALPVARRVA